MYQVTTQVTKQVQASINAVPVAVLLRRGLGPSGGFAGYVEMAPDDDLTRTVYTHQLSEATVNQIYHLPAVRELIAADLKRSELFSNAPRNDGNG